jgi:hypothetical protein
MAEILKRTETVVRSFYRLDLTEEEVKVLAVVLGAVSGPTTGYRGVSQGILDALSSEGVDWYNSAANRKYSGYLTFDDEK